MDIYNGVLLLSVLLSFSLAGTDGRLLNFCAWRPDLSADLPGHLTGPVATPHVVYYSLYHIFISVLMYTTRTTQITYPNPDSYHNLPIP
jgi:hypothetical protein